MKSADAADVVAETAPVSGAADAVPEYPVSPPPVPAAAAAPRGGFPPLVWVILGVVLAKTFDFVSKLMRGGPGNMQQNMQAMMMQKMMEQMMSGKGGPMPGMGGMDPSSNPFAAMAGGGGGGGAAGNPFANMPPFPQQPAQSSPAASSPGFPASGNFPASPAYDTTASAAAKQPEQTPKVSPTETKQPASAASAGSTAASTSAPARPKRSAFVDVDDEDSSGGTAAAGGSGGTAEAPREPEVMPGGAAGAASGGFPAGFSGGFPMPGGQSDTAGVSDQAAANGADGQNGGGSSKATMAMLERMMTDENLQKMLYPYLPEPMRNPETFKWMLSNPEYRQQLETMMAQQGANPAMNDLINNFSYDSPELKEQLESIGMTPDEVLQKIMADPELAMSFSKPEVQEAIMDVTQNQMNITKYANNPEIMAVFNKMSTLFTPK